MDYRLKGFSVGFSTGILGGLVGLGGAEFRLPLLLKFFNFNTLEAIILNKFMSLITVSFSIVFRSQALNLSNITSNIQIIITFLSGSLIGAWFAADWATKVKHSLLNKVIAFLMTLIAIVMLLRAYIESFYLGIDGFMLILITVVVGFFIGIVSAILGVAGGELYIPSITLLYNTNIKLSGTLSLLISFPTMLAAFARYSKDNSFVVIRNNKSLSLWMVGGTFLGSFVGGYLLLSLLPEKLIIYILVLLLFISAYKIWKH
ncbi:MAG: sulfite exporter TauE/SafE family protein [Hydrogenothermaceae bacterium]